MRNFYLSLAVGAAGNAAWYASDHTTWSAYGWIICALAAAVIVALPSRA